MAFHLDHLMVPSRNKMAAAKLLAELLGVAWSETGARPFVSVYVNDGLTFDFDEPAKSSCPQITQINLGEVLVPFKVRRFSYSYQ